ncbi:MAG: hypothetical protein HZA77_12960 [Candidatus Schekmanbacteria bacterium]|nr:hypothetical protein [Candidatus Schekmanbacteria bacterium]
MKNLKIFHLKIILLFTILFSVCQGSIFENQAEEKILLIDNWSNFMNNKYNELRKIIPLRNRRPNLPERGEFEKSVDYNRRVDEIENSIRKEYQSSIEDFFRPTYRFKGFKVNLGQYDSDREYYDYANVDFGVPNVFLCIDSGLHDWIGMIRKVVIKNAKYSEDQCTMINITSLKVSIDAAPTWKKNQDLLRVDIDFKFYYPIEKRQAPGHPEEPVLSIGLQSVKLYFDGIIIEEWNN